MFILDARFNFFSKAIVGNGKKKYTSENKLTDDELDRTLERMVKRIVRKFKPEQIILFGSRARGDARSDSDFDLLVVMPVEGTIREKRIEVRMALGGINVSKDIIVVTPEEFAWQRNQVGTIAYPAVREGRVLYARNG